MTCGLGIEQHGHSRGPQTLHCHDLGGIRFPECCPGSTEKRFQFCIYSQLYNGCLSHHEVWPLQCRGKGIGEKGWVGVGGRTERGWRGRREEGSRGRGRRKLYLGGNPPILREVAGTWEDISGCLALNLSHHRLQRCGNH
jgi:hypothetical protein